MVPLSTGEWNRRSCLLYTSTKEIKPKYGDDCEFTIVLCSDTDVFDFAPKPPIKWDEVKKDLANSGAAKVIHVQAKRSIEDWFLYDIEGILGFLRLGKNTKVSGKNGYDKLQRLYKQANKVYYKGIQLSLIHISSGQKSGDFRNWYFCRE